MLEKDPNIRPSADQVLEDSWFEKYFLNLLNNLVILQKMFHPKILKRVYFNLMVILNKILYNKVDFFKQ